MSGEETRVADDATSVVTDATAEPAVKAHEAGNVDPRVALGVYVHVPFCARACPYCDFDFEVGRRPRLDGRSTLWWDGIRSELAQRRAETTGRVVDTLYFGGGTPSALGPALLAEVVGGLRRELDVRDDAEITVEVNPEHVDDALVAALRAGGATRVSIGVQSTDPRALTTLGRAHDAARGIAAVTVLVAAGFDVSVDLIVGWPGQDVTALRADVDRLASLGARHLSVYALTIEADVPWMSLVRRGQRSLPDLDEQGSLLEVVESQLADVGFSHYEVASYGRRGGERTERDDLGPSDRGGGHGTGHDRSGIEARHNRKYWTWQDVLALGPSAASVSHDRETGEVRRRSNPRGLDAWLAVLDGASDVIQTETLSPEHAAKEGLWLGLRRLAGFDLAEFLRVFPRADRGWVRHRLDKPLARGLVTWGDDDTIALAPRAWLHHDAVGAHVLR